MKTSLMKTNNRQGRPFSLSLLVISFLFFIGVQSHSWVDNLNTGAFENFVSQEFPQLEKSNLENVEVAVFSQNGFAASPNSPSFPSPTPWESENDQEKDEKEDTNDDDYSKFSFSEFVSSEQSKEQNKYNQLVSEKQRQACAPLYILFHTWKLHLI